MMTSVPSTSIYGFGEHEHPSFKHDMNYVRYGMFSRDQSPVVMCEHRFLLLEICLLKEKEGMDNKNDFLDGAEFILVYT